jgi:hypothetical protein
VAAHFRSFTGDWLCSYGTPPDLHLVILQPCDGWLGKVMLTLLMSLAAKPHDVTAH